MIPDDILQRFEADAAGQFQWDDYAHQCAACGVSFATGDVVIVHGDLSVAIANIEHRCRECGYEKIVESGKSPTGMAVHVERKYKRKLLSEIPSGTADRIRGAFETIVEVEKLMSELAARAEQAKEEA